MYSQQHQFASEICNRRLYKHKIPACMGERWRRYPRDRSGSNLRRVVIPGHRGGGSPSSPAEQMQRPGIQRETRRRRNIEPSALFMLDPRTASRTRPVEDDEKNA
jgi:hypothetical protein